MENITKFVSSWSHSQESAASRRLGVVGNHHLATGLLLGFLLLGLITVILAFWSQRRGLKERIVFFCTYRHSSLKALQVIHDTLFNLLYMNIINGIIAIVLAVYFISKTCDFICNEVYILWFLSRSFGIVLHLLCALLSVLHLCHPHWRVKLRSISTVVGLLTIPFILLFYYFTLVGLIGLAVITFGLALAIIVKSFGSTASPSAAASKRWIVFVAMFTFLVIYLPTFVFDCLMITYPSNSNYAFIYSNLVYGTSIQFVLDGFLCLLILRLPTEVEEQQQQPQHGTEIPRVNAV